MSIHLETGDIARFWHAVDQATPDNALEVLQREYFDQASPGLRDFIASRIESVDKLWATLEAKRAYYTAIRVNTLRVGEMRPQIEAACQRFEELLEDATFPSVYFVIGRMTSGGTLSKDNIQIGTELFSTDSSTPLHELNAWECSVVKPLEVLPAIVAHELAHFVHFQTLRRANPILESRPNTVLEDAFIEGVADYLGEWASGGIINSAIHRFGLEHEAELKQRFKLEMNGSDSSGWLYQGDRAEGEPADLGYFIGHQIVKHYLERQPNFKRGVRALLETTDVERVALQSGYLD